MAGQVIFAELEAFSKKLEQLCEKEVDRFSKSAIKELAARLLDKVVKRTPVYKSIPDDVNDHTGGYLRRGWTVGKVKKVGSGFTIEVFNPIEYAEYVEYGHRGVYVPSVGKTLHTDTHWTKGKFMLTISKEELEKELPQILEKRLDAFIRSIESDK